MPVGNITGLSSGLQWDQTVDLIMQIESRPVDILQVQKAQSQSKLSTWSSIESKLTALDTTAQDFDSVNEFLIKTGSSEDTDVVTVTAGATAIPASHDIIVNQLAQATVHAHETGWVDADTTPVNDSGGNQSFSYDYGGEAVTITVPDGTTLTGLVTLINSDENNPGVTASILNDGTGGGADYHLMLAGDDTGAGNDITIIDTGANPTDLGTLGTEFDESEWDTTRDAQNAEIRVDGFPDPAWGWPNPWIESESNDVKDVIPGVTLHLHDDSGGSTIKFDIGLDTESIKNNVQTLIGAYNEVITEINASSRFNAETEESGVLNGDALARSIRTELLTLISSNIPGTDTSDTYRTLGQVGVSIGSGGKLSLDADELEEALEADSVGVARLFAFDAYTDSSFTDVIDYSENTVGGSYAYTVSYNASGEINSGGTNTIDGVQAKIHGTQLLGGAADSDVDGVLMTLIDPGDGPSSITGTAKIYTGINVLLHNTVDRLTDPDEGSLGVNTDLINDAIDSLDDRISAWETRLEKVREGYERQFSQMEVLIGQLQTQGNFLSAI